MSINSLYLQRLVRLTEKHGSLPEQQLLGRWRPELASFLQPADRQLLSGELGLEFGIEDTLALKINLKAKGMEAITTLLGLVRQSSTLAPWGDYILKNQTRFHCGLKLTPQRLSRELYVYPKEYNSLASLIGDTPFYSAVLEVKPSFIGIDDGRGFSMYFEAAESDWVETLRSELGLANWGDSRLQPWQQIRFDGTRLLKGKTAIELAPLPATVLARFISHYPFPYFRFLFNLRDYPDGNFGRDPITGRFALYATVNLKT